MSPVLDKINAEALAPYCAAARSKPRSRWSAPSDR
jgi:hypothetical protein